MKTISALAALAIGLISTQAEACNVNRISGVYEVAVTQWQTWRPGSGAPVPEIYERIIHTTCRFDVGRISPDRARINVHCNAGWQPDRPCFAYGGFPCDPFPAAFAQDGVPIEDGRPARTFPWHQLHHNSGCRWALVDLNEIDGEYVVTFSLDGQSLIGRGGGWTGPSYEEFFNSFTGVKIRR